LGKELKLEKSKEMFRAFPEKVFARKLKLSPFSPPYDLNNMKSFLQQYLGEKNFIQSASDPDLPKVSEQNCKIYRSRSCLSQMMRRIEMDFTFLEIMLGPEIVLILVPNCGKEVLPLLQLQLIFLISNMVRIDIILSN
jgi:hypothetical protein